ncbi:Zn-dependent hydrolase [Clostridium aminobutyricum]|uniref:Zn-dependent hydrolase n=1 Tax=Clostridium aminobutyricum TaxID=33953 RepID=A0A939IHE3_CLOAM|nr:Zn-dependent hydrolase [Clostridium aminobutyricum]MBN7773652.1 Zn-dependent hydrolase [Clostridium aminobutyricum]
MYTCDVKRMEDKIKTFSTFGDAGHGGITRYSLSPEAIMARNEFIKRMTAIHAEIVTDDMANMYATLPGSDPSAKRIVMASHCDSVKNGGNYDGILGVMGAMEVLETIAAEDIPHTHPVTAMIWTNEEGSLYPPAMMSSGVVCNDFLPTEIAKKFKQEDMLASKSVLDRTRTFGEALESSGFKGDKKNRLNPDDYKCMFELHIEQGPILEDAGNDVGVVTCVLGMFNYRIRFYGQSDHAGTTPMHKRQDALHAAAQALCYLHEEIDKLDRPELVYTTGEILCHPCVHTVIPDFVDFSIDVRHEDPAVRQKVLAIVKGLADREWAKCRCEVELAWARDTVYFDKELVSYVKEAAEQAGVKHQYINSGAGHDAQFVSYMLPTTMIFVVSKDGHSHCEPEYSSPEQCTNGATVMLNAVLKADAS